MRSLTLEGKKYLLLLGFSFLMILLFQKKPTANDSISIIRIHVEGESKKRGTFVIPKGMLVREVLQGVGTTPLSNLTAIDLDRKLVESQTLVIPRKKFILVEIKGAVDREGKYTLPVDARMCDLPKLVKIKKTADKKFFRSRKKISRYKKIKIPFVSIK